MDEPIVSQLLDLNRQFYGQFAHPFSATRQRVQPGVRRIAARLPAAGRLLDLGCGNGVLARELSRRGFHGEYLGLDFSAELLPQEPPASAHAARFEFRVADLSAPDWDAGLPPAAFDAVLAFAVLHHLPGRALRLDVLRRARRLIAPEGRFYHSEWQFYNSRRFIGRILPWERAGIDPAQVEPGDALLDWRRLPDGSSAATGGAGLRYVHHFSLDELADLASAAGFRILETFSSDGAEGNLGLYQVWAPA